MSRVCLLRSVFFLALAAADEDVQGREVQRPVRRHGRVLEVPVIGGEQVELAGPREPPEQFKKA